MLDLRIVEDFLRIVDGARGNPGLLKGPPDLAHVDDTVNVFKYEDLSDVVLVGHSNGGVVISKTAEQVPACVRKLIYLAAVVLEDGEAVQDIGSRLEWTQQNRVSDDRAGTLGVDPKVSASIQCHDGTPEQIA